MGFVANFNRPNVLPTCYAFHLGGLCVAIPVHAEFTEIFAEVAEASNTQLFCAAVVSNRLEYCWGQWAAFCL